ncbi:MAG: ABC transporter permease [Arenicellales bacterium]
MTNSRLIYYRDLIRELVLRDIKIRYKRSALGFAWTLANPLLYLVVFYFVFKIALDINIPRFGVFAFTGILAWGWFQSSLAQSAGAIVSSRELVRSPGFSPAVLPIVIVTSNLVNFLVALVVLLAYQLIVGTGIGWQVWPLPLLIALQFILTLSIAYVIAALNVVFRDVGHLVAVLLHLMFFLTPIFYDASMIPDKFQMFYRLNPMVHFVESYRSVLLNDTGLNWWPIAIIGCFSILLLFIGRALFIKLSFRFAEEI